VGTRIVSPEEKKSENRLAQRTITYTCEKGHVHVDIYVKNKLVRRTVTYAGPDKKVYTDFYEVRE
jgi:hypothetical protein